MHLIEVMQQRVVSILVILELALEDIEQVLVKLKPYVSILVILELALEGLRCV